MVEEITENFDNLRHLKEIFDNCEKELKEIQIPLNYAIVDMQFPPNSLITPKTEMDRFIHDQYPYISDNSITMLPHNYPQRPSALLDLSNPTV